jgi:hypothetical protein
MTQHTKQTEREERSSKGKKRDDDDALLAKRLPNKTSSTYLLEP